MSRPDFIAPPPGARTPPLSLAARVGDLLFVSGTPGYDEAGALAPTFAAQFRRSVENLEAILARAGCGLADVAKVNVLLTRASDVAEMNALYAAAFAAPYPARTTCVVAALPDPAMLLEIECVAALPAGARTSGPTP